MLNAGLAIMRKDLRLLFHAGGALCQPLLLGGIILFLFSMANGPGEAASPKAAAAAFWLSSVFCQTLVFGQLYALEEANQARQALLLAGAPLQGVWLGKAAAGLVFLCLAQLIFLPAAIVFLNQSVSGALLPGLLGIGSVDLGIAILGSLLGALQRGSGGRDALLSVLLFPLLTPLLMAGQSLCARSLGGEGGDWLQWLGLALAFDAIFSAAALLAFGFLYGGED